MTVLSAGKHVEFGTLRRAGSAESITNLPRVPSTSMHDPYVPLQQRMYFASAWLVFLFVLAGFLLSSLLLRLLLCGYFGCLDVDSQYYTGDF